MTRQITSVHKLVYFNFFVYQNCFFFSQAENAVVFECVASLFDKGYKPEHIILEKGMPGGQLFNYYNSFRQAQYICLYASNFADDELSLRA